ncbi:SusD/RagB family nutrient-binding outer membrane lipoprotein [Flavobacterium sp. SUN052]|uniref:SusD/RagB family nutrient-binding outer membrane lipoprotein n=1 Tax=Flavobacterium sp. SUN052 TaxID=3002441 RepID=UPI00237DEDAD|nr:SusD/RagB family nutrient-binding outer membrane lipoprotein [Flavobacterium sp. SUN052]MEC4004778.1 SusD/RagB family nutrient-binding outer membrane lipoprotein [Flavobacterium sp. SUN052]
MKKIKFLAPILAFAFFSCDNYLDINSPSPNDLSFSQATPSKLLPGAQVSTYRVQATTMNQLGNVFMNSWTRNVQSFGNGFDRELQLQIDNGFYTGIWDGLFRNLKNFDAIIKYPNPTGKYDLYIAAAKICKAHYMQEIVDLYGDAPYTQAWQGNDNTTPAYDDDYAIYQALIGELEDARNLIANAGPTAEDITPYDVMLGGDMSRWNEFANTLQLRFCVHMSEVTGAKATYRDTKLADIAAGPFLSDNVTVNPGFSDASNDNQNPEWGNFEYDAAGNLLQNRTFITMTGHAYKSLQSYATTNYPAAGSQEIVAGTGVFYPNITDGRSGRLFTGAPSNPRRAVNQGSTLVDVGAPTTTFPGLPCRVGLAGNFYPYGVHDGTLSGYSSIEGYIMTFSESELLQAEAAVRWPSLFSGGQTHFQDAITDNFLIRNATIGSYLTTINTKPNFGWIGTDTQKIHAILYQKWIATMGVYNPIQSFIDYNRTGFPYTPLSSNATQTRKPYRLIYPVSEYVANSANVPSMTSAEVFSINSKTPFWVPGAPN